MVYVDGKCPITHCHCFRNILHLCPQCFNTATSSQSLGASCREMPNTPASASKRMGKSHGRRWEHLWLSCGIYSPPRDCKAVMLDTVPMAVHHCFVHEKSSEALPRPSVRGPGQFLRTFRTMPLKIRRVFHI